MKQNKNKENLKSRLVDYFNQQEEVPSQEEVADLWQQIKLGIEQQRYQQQKKRHYYFWTTSVVAAALVGLAWLFFAHYFQEYPQDFSVVATEMLNNTTESDKIRLIVSPQEEYHVDRDATVVYTQNGDIRINEQKVSKSSTKGLYDRLIVPKGEFTRLILSDGSVLYVNAGTKVVYPKQFAKNKREIFVDGEIYIDVKHDESAPFYVKTAQFYVQVLGTAFDVKAYSDVAEQAEVVLLRGKVNVKSNAGRKLLLAPNNRAIVFSDGRIISTPVNATDRVLWTQGILSLNGDELRDILGKLGRYYGLDIHCHEEIARVRIAGKIDLKCGIQEALERISSAGGFTFQHQKGSYLLKAGEKREILR